MSNKLLIKVKIFDRYYPININTEEEEEKVRLAAKKINETISRYKSKYNRGDKDNQDFFAMAALQFMTKIIDLENKKDYTPLIEDLKDLDFELEEYIENNK